MPRSYKPKPCSMCGETFQPTNAKSRVCETCRTVSCQTCGTPFVVPASALATAKFCSRACKHKAPKGLKPVPCELCSTSFKPRSGMQRICDVCLTRECEHCGKAVRIKPKEVSTFRFCSHRCKSKAQMHYVFNEDDLQFIRDNYPYNISMKGLAERFSTSISAINRILEKAGAEKCPINLRNARAGETRRKWTKETMIEAIQELHELGEVSLHAAAARMGGLVNIASQHFGSWREAVEVAGFNYDEINLYACRTTWTTDLIIDKVREMHAAGESLRASDARDNQADVFNAARREPELASWEAAVEAAGFDYAEVSGDSFGTVTRGADGGVYRSTVEARVADDLLRLQVEGLILSYEYEAKVCSSRRWTCDFLVSFENRGRLWLEVDGLGERRRDGAYEEGHPKILHYQEKGFEYAIVGHESEVRGAIEGHLSQGHRQVELPSERRIDA